MGKDLLGDHYVPVESEAAETDADIGTAVHRDAFDEEWDVVVVGYGYAGGVAALEAARAGVEVVVLEKEPVPGGISICSSGAVTCAEDANAAAAYLAATNAGRVRADVEGLLAQGMTELEDYLKGLAETSEATVSVQTGKQKAGNYPFPGWDTFYTVSVAEVPAFDPAVEFPHAKVQYPDTDVKRGVNLFKVLDENLDAAGVSVRLDAKVTRLVTDVTRSSIRGVVVHHEGEELTIKARRGVVLASGGFESNEWMKRQYLEGMPVLPTVANNTGDGIRLAMDMGADLWHMWHLHGAYGFEHPDPSVPYGIRVKRLPDWLPEESPSFLARVHSDEPDPSPTAVADRSGASADDKAVVMSWILLDQHGERFMNEYPPYLQDTANRPMQRFDPERQRFPRIPAFLVCDDEGRRRYPLGRPKHNSADPSLAYEWSEDNLKEVEAGILERAESVRELARQLGLDPDAVEASVDRWNSLCEQGEDADFGRPAPSMLPVTEPPFLGGAVYPVVSNTQGGPVRNGRNQVLRPTDEPISRLYAAGEMGSPFGHLYISGANLSDCFVGGWVAGRDAASLETWDP